MSYYENGIETKRRILAACRKLFYEKGYQQTTFKDICAEAQVNQSAIHYHFKAKEALLAIIYEETVVKNNREVERFALRDTLPLTKYFLSNKLYIYKLLHDRRFFQLNLDATLFLDTSHYDERIQIMASGIYGKNRSLVVLSERDYFNAMAVTGFDHSVLIYLSKDDALKDYNQLSAYAMEIYRNILKIDDNTFAVITRQLAELEPQIRWDRLDTSLEM